jgi:hypothetical protein
MRELLRQLEAALDANLYYLALFTALALPDICGAIDSPSDGVGARYRAWFDKYVAPKYLWNGHQYLTGADCYHFRCSLLHQGSAQIPRSNYSRVIFIEPLEDELTSHLNLIGDALNVDLYIFCNDIVRSVREWLDKVENTQKYKDNYATFMRWYPQGLPEHGINRPVIT